MMHFPVYESAAVKVINGDTHLSANERAAIEKFENATWVTRSKRKGREEAAEGDVEKRKKEEDSATAILRVKKTAAASPTSVVYSELLMKLPPRSNRVECLFSQAKVMLTPLRVSLLPVNIEMLMFLRTNRSYWDLATVSAIYQQA
ncbi:hypothetical protein PR002_g4866 [Phytophthora rubi]|uniref:HAT C-terminal dimerisation domain-containing protein n=1 Tax=Phytophthora rubi TaxID=129364 RepID=A0A6A3NEX5_9STRA|nr:hypothetical protein PR002_g4866 [Phytophthora rubi]